MTKENNERDNNISRRKIGLLPLGAAALGIIAGTQAQASGRPRPHNISIEDRMALIDLMNLYTWAYDFGNAEVFSDTFIPEGIVIAFGNEEARGKQSIIDFANRLFRIRGDKHWQHCVDQHIFMPASDGYRVYSYYSMHEGDIPNRQFKVSSFGHYISDCVKINGQWRFKQRQIIRGNGANLPWLA